MMNQTLRVRWLVDHEFQVRNDVYLTIAEDRIAKITRVRPEGPIREIDGLVVPGLVNAHTHLEFSDLGIPLGEPGGEFVDWIRKVVAYRNSRTLEQQCQAVQSGLQEMVDNGTVAIGEISTFDWRTAVESGIAEKILTVDFRELIGFLSSQHEEIQIRAKLHLGQSAPHCIPGLSPHAPYSINRRSLEWAVSVSAEKKIPLAMHLAESNDEMQLLENHQGPFRELLEQLGLWTDENFSTCSCPGDFLELLSNASRALIVHGNYLNRDDLHRIRTQSNVLKLVYCPRTHNFFGHEQYPLEWIRQLGIELALGTDSRASNPDLSIWNEMEFLLENQSEFSPLEILRLGTLNGAKALGLEDSLGTLQPGKLARLFVAPLAGESHLGRAIIESA